MGRKDTMEKEFMADNEIFADVVNGTVFDGEQVVRPEDLQEHDTTEVYSEIINGELLSLQRYRDVLKCATIKTTKNCCYMIIGVENQTEVNYAMVVRTMLYDAINYSEQVVTLVRNRQKNSEKKYISDYFTGLRKDDRLIPVITIIVYFGTKKWDAPRSLHELFPEDLPEKILKVIPDYKVPVLSPEEIDNPEVFRTDMQAVVRFLSACGKKDKKQLINMICSDPRFRMIDRKAASIINEVTGIGLRIPDDQKEVNMCEVVKEWREELLETGKSDGAKKTEDVFARLSASMQEHGCSSDDIIRTMSDADFRKEMMKKFSIS